MRAPLRQQIWQSWQACIRKDYLSQRVNSERSLQASLWSELNARLTRNRRLFIEPSMRFTFKGHRVIRHPDIVVCNSQSVIGVIELKYLPRAQPNYHGDILKLSTISLARSQIEISNDRFRGLERDSKKYKLANKTLFVWAGIHKATIDTPHLYSQDEGALWGCYMQLHAATRSNGPPEIYEVY